MPRAYEEEAKGSAVSHREAFPIMYGSDITLRTHEELQEKSFSQDIQIQSLLLEFDRLKAERKIHDWMEKAHSDSASEGRASEASG